MQGGFRPKRGQSGKVYTHVNIPNCDFPSTGFHSSPLPHSARTENMPLCLLEAQFVWQWSLVHLRATAVKTKGADMG
jgi:hypothetical protein